MFLCLGNILVNITGLFLVEIPVFFFFFHFYFSFSYILQDIPLHAKRLFFLHFKPRRLNAKEL